MVQPEQSLSHAANLTPRGRRNHPRVSHACQRCRAKKAKCDQQQPCSTCVKHAADCEYGIRRRSGRKKQQPYQNQSNDQAETPGARPSPRFTALDVVGDINQRTQGTEFYGTSSNFVLLNQLFASARQHDPSRYVSSEDHESISELFPAGIRSHNELPALGGDRLPISSSHHVQTGLTALSQDRVSIINLLSNEEVLSPPSRPKTPAGVPSDLQVESRSTGPICGGVRNGHSGSILRESPLAVPQSTRPEHTADIMTPPCASIGQNDRNNVVSLQASKRRRLEKAYIHVFFNNLHHLHPMLDPFHFEERCERDIGGTRTTTERQKGFRHFSALYNIVVAVGALIAGRNVLEDLGPDMQTCIVELVESGIPERRISSQIISRTYFRKSKDRLGDTSAVCSLESAQTLLLMSLYCQNSHMPHRCYMYCGQAVRTALAIGLANESASMSAEDRKAARRTWWCIYSHEIDMSCSSGRRDSLRKPHSYQIPLPLIKDVTIEVSGAPETENKNVAMINEMVRFAAILRRISKELYHDAKSLTLPEKSTIAMELDGLLSDWKANLPEWLDFGTLSFREEEWAGKQKLVLHLRYLNARILAHRLFLAPSTNDHSLDVSDHVGLCLDAARETIRVLHDAYAHRHYFRTWWYNSTYTLYAGMIVLYVILQGATALRSEDLLDDVIKAQNILESMQEATVALRSAKLLREVLGIARSRNQRDAANSGPLSDSCTDQVNDEIQGQRDVNDFVPNAHHYFPQAIFATDGHCADPGPLFAPLIDPGLLQDFTTGLDASADIDTSAFLFEDLYNDRLGVFPTIGSGV
ncbi:putative C6 transcription factor [Periconia macrospinosa]|uniref:Putative C6 transcription factor n=1 Tax=Periconia macrospinosa TaxID=97972 RepID=A0A2V1E2S7_9PLEO|nr:putative C6 transcription factor [Periconia macrospinosa]